MDTDFIGFQYGEAHSRDFDLYRVSVSNRYEEQLIPQFNENKTTVPGGDGTYFFDANYTQRQFKVSFAFDSLTETQYRQLRLWLGNKDTFKQLIFDERPYKYYMAKPSAPPTLKTLCFTENNARVYKGEGEVTFVCYYPFARTLYGLKYGNQFTDNIDCDIDLYYRDSHSQDQYTGKTSFVNFSLPSLFKHWFSSKTKVYYTLQGQEYECTMKDFYNMKFKDSDDTIFQITKFIPDTTIPYFTTTADVTIAITNFTNYKVATINTNVSEWNDSVNWLSSRSTFDQFTTTDSSATAYLYNPGDLSADYKITLDYIPESISMINSNFGEVQLVHFTTPTMPTITIPTTTTSNNAIVTTATTITANRIQIDSKTNMIKVGTTADPSSTAAADFIPVEMFNTAADVMNFVTIPVDAMVSAPTSISEANTQIVITGVSSDGKASIDYDYLYY